MTPQCVVYQVHIGMAHSSNRALQSPVKCWAVSHFKANAHKLRFGREGHLNKSWKEYVFSYSQLYIEETGKPHLLKLTNITWPHCVWLMKCLHSSGQQSMCWLIKAHLMPWGLSCCHFLRSYCISAVSAVLCHCCFQYLERFLKDSATIIQTSTF